MITLSERLMGVSIAALACAPVAYGWVQVGYVFLPIVSSFEALEGEIDG